MKEKILKSLMIISIITILLFEILVIAICFKLARYNNCRQIGFDSPVCESYKNF